MRRITLVTLALTPSGCSYNTWWNPLFTGGYNPNLPVNDSENLRRVQGQEPSVSPLTTRSGSMPRYGRLATFFGIHSNAQAVFLHGRSQRDSAYSDRLCR
jgi:hypothetical protein